MNDGRTVTVTLLVVLLFAIASTIIYGFVFMVLWNWFVPVALGAPSLDLAPAIGIRLLVNLFFVSVQNKKDGSDSLGEMFVNRLVVMPLFILLIGYVVHCFV